MSRTLVVLVALCCVALESRAAESLTRYLPADTPGCLTVEGGARLASALRAGAAGRIYDEPEVQLLVAEIARNTGAGYAAFEAKLGFPVSELLALFDGEVTLAITGVSASTNPFGERLVLGASGDVAAWRKMVALALARLEQAGVPIKRGAFSLKQCEVATLRIGPLSLQQAEYGGFYFLATDGAALAELIGRIERKAADSLATKVLYQAVRARATKGAPGAFFYADVQAVLDQVLVGPLATQRGLVEKIGVHQVQALGVASVATDKGFVERIVVHSPGAKAGVFDVLAAFPPADRATLALAPEKTVFALSAAVAPLDLLSRWRDYLGTLDTAQYKSFADGLTAVEASLGIPLKDALGELGPRVLVYGTMPDHEGLFPDIAALVEVRDPVRFRATLDRIIARATRAGEDSPALDVRTVACEGGSFQYINLSRLGQQQVIAPAFVLHDHWLVIGATPVTMKHALADLRNPARKGLLDAPRWAPFASQVDPAWGGLFYLDAGRLLVATYGTFLPFFQAVLPKGDVPFEPALLPQPSVLARHLYGVGLAVGQSPDGPFVELVSPIGLIPFLLVAATADQLQKLANAYPAPGAAASPVPAPAMSAPLVSFAFDQATLADALDHVARTTGAEVRFSRAQCESMKVTARAEGLSLDRALAMLIPADKLAWRLRSLPGGVMQVVVYARAGAEAATGAGSR